MAPFLLFVFNHHHKFDRLLGLTPCSVVEIHLRFQNHGRECANLTASHPTTCILLGMLNFVEIRLVRRELSHDNILARSRAYYRTCHKRRYEAVCGPPSVASLHAGVCQLRS